MFDKFRLKDVLIKCKQDLLQLSRAMKNTNGKQ